MKAYKVLSIIVIIIAVIPIVVIGIHIYGDYKEFKSCKDIRDYKYYINKQRYVYKWNNKVLLYPNVFQNKAIEIYSSMRKEIIKDAQKNLNKCKTITQYDEFIKKYECYYDDEEEIRNLINKAFYELRPLEATEENFWGDTDYEWEYRIWSFSKKHPKAKKILEYETN